MMGKIRRINHFIYKKNYFYAFIFIFLLLSFHGMGNLEILNESRFNLSGDSAFNYIESHIFFQELHNFFKNRDFYNLLRAYIQLGGRYRPPFLMITASVFYFIFGVSENIAVLSNIFYFAILLFATYGIGKKLYDFKIGLLASFLVSMFPAVFGLSRVFLQDFALVSFVALSFYLFLLSENFKNLKYSLLFGASAGLGLLTKWSYAIFIMPILIYSLGRIVTQRNSSSLKNFLISFIFGLILASTWYVPNYGIILPRLSKIVFNVVANNDKWFYYIESLVQFQLLWPYFLLFLSAAFFFILRKDLFLPLLIIIPFVVFSFSANKTSRFILPVFIFIAIMMAKLVSDLDKRKVFISCVILFSFIQYFLVCFIPNDFLWLRTIKTITHKYPDSQQGFYVPVDRGNWMTDKIFQAITNSSMDAQKPVQVLVIPNQPSLLWGLKIASHFKKESTYFICPAEWDGSVNIHPNFDTIVLGSDYVITKSGSQGNPWQMTYLTNTEKSFFKHKDKFFVLDSFLLTGADGSELYIYKKRANAS